MSMEVDCSFYFWGYLRSFRTNKPKKPTKSGDYYFCLTSFVWSSSLPQQGTIAHYLELNSGRGRQSLISLSKCSSRNNSVSQDLVHNSWHCFCSICLKWSLWVWGSLKWWRSPLVINLKLYLFSVSFISSSLCVHQNKRSLVEITE